MYPYSWHEELVAAVQTAETVADAEVIKKQLNAIVVTPDDLTTLVVNGRGQYHPSDTRGYVIEQETRCMQWNCWMLRKPDGTESYVSEAPTP